MLVVVLVLVLDTKRLKSFEDEHEDETANELIETALILRSFFFDQTSCHLPACDELSRIEAAARVILKSDNIDR